MTSNSSGPLARARRRSFAWFILLALIFVILGFIGQLPLPAIIALAILPTAAGLWLSRTGTRVSTANPEEFGIHTGNAHASGSISLPASLERTREVIKEAVSDLDHFSLLREGKDQIDIAVRWSLKSWGEVISLRLNRDAQGSTRLVAEVRPKIRTNVVDFGQGGDDLATLFSEVRRRCE